MMNTMITEVYKGMAITKLEVTVYNYNTEKMEKINNVYVTYVIDEWDENMFKVSDEIEELLSNKYNETDGYDLIDWLMVETIAFDDNDDDECDEV